MKHYFAFVCAGVSSTALVAGCSAQEGDANSEKAGPPPAAVSVALVTTDSINDEWTFLGEVRAGARAEVAAGASGAITKVSVRIGDVVRRGQLLLEIDAALVAAQTDVAAAQVAESEVLLAQARRDVERLESLGARAVSRSEVEQARSELSALESQVAARRAAARESNARYGRHRIRAPFEGVVLDRKVDAGDWVDPGTRLFDLVSIADADVLVGATGELLAYVQAGAKVRLRSPRGEIGGKVVATVPALDPKGRTTRIRIEPESRPPWFFPGSTVDVVFTVDLSGEGIVVPRDAVLETAAGVRVVKVSADDSAAPVNVEIIARSRNRMLVRSDTLVDGDRVVVRGNERLRPGQALAVGETHAAAGTESNGGQVLPQ